MPHKLCKLFSSLLCLGSTRARPAQLNDNKALYQRLFLHLMTVSPSSSLAPSLILSLCNNSLCQRWRTWRKTCTFLAACLFFLLFLFSSLSLLHSLTLSLLYSPPLYLLYSLSLLYPPSLSIPFPLLSFTYLYRLPFLFAHLFSVNLFKVEQKYLVCTKVTATYHNLLHAAIIYSCLLHLLELLLKFIVPMLNYLVND